MGRVFFVGSKPGMKLSRLPSGYTELEFIQSSGTQYIDSGFVPNQDTRVVAEVINYKQNTVFGARSSSYSNTFTVTSSGGYYRTDYNKTIKNIIANPILDKMTIDKNKNVTNFNGTVITHDYATFTAPGNMYIFAMNNNGNVYDYGEVGICSMQIYDNGTIVRDYVPCITDGGEVGLYDIVNSRFYGNAGSGVFIGSEVAA